MRTVSLTVLLAALLATLACAQDFTGTVVRVMDGDSLWIRNARGQELEVRLADVDAPERDQPYADAARDALRALVLDKTVEVRFNDVDDYGRIVARLYAGNLDVSAEMLERGLAWAYLRYLRDRSLLAREAAARDARRGLWGAAQAPVPPWDWRRGVRAPTQVATELLTCSTRKTACRQMASCEEALFYLRQCGVDTLDGDGDGVPCEAICPAPRPLN